MSTRHIAAIAIALPRARAGARRRLQITSAGLAVAASLPADEFGCLPAGTPAVEVRVGASPRWIGWSRETADSCAAVVTIHPLARDDARTTGASPSSPQSESV
jgi:hypothetical protein